MNFSLLNTCLLIVFVIGHIELLVTIVNRVHGLRIPQSVLTQVRHAHDLLIPLFPPVLFWFVGISGPGLILGGAWTDLSVGWQAYLTVCAMGFAGFVVSWCRHGWQCWQRANYEVHCRTIDIAAEIGECPQGDGYHSYLAKVPGNEIYQIELTEKEAFLPRLPAACDGLSILHISDLHFHGTPDRRYFDYLFDHLTEWEPDLVVFTGDLLDEQRLTDWLPTTLGRLDAPLGRFFILGNHDWYLEERSIHKAIEELGWINVAGRTFDLQHENHKIVIGGSEMPWMAKHPNFSQSPEEEFRILLSHTPDNFNWSRSHDVDLMLSGHNHGGQVVLPFIGPVYSPSIHGVRYAGGTFRKPPTLMHVSRGISGRYPLRLNCKPEATLLSLRAGVKRPRRESMAVAVSDSATVGEVPAI